MVYCMFCYGASFSFHVIWSYVTKCINGYRKKVDGIEATLATNSIYHTVNVNVKALEVTIRNWCWRNSALKSWRKIYEMTPDAETAGNIAVAWLLLI